MSLTILCLGLLLMMYSTNNGKIIIRPAFMWIGIIIVIGAIITIIIKNKHKNEE